MEAGNGLEVAGNPEVITALRDAGWHEGRRYDIGEWLEMLEARGFDINANAIQAWQELGGLTIDSVSSRYPASSLRVDPVEACIDAIDDVAELLGRHGMNYSPLGMWSEQFKAYIGADGRVLASDLGQEYLLGYSLPEALEFVVVGESGGKRRAWSSDAYADDPGGASAPALAAEIMFQTTPSSWLIRAVWPARTEMLESCVARLRRYVDDLAGIDPGLGRWYRMASESGEVLDPIDGSEGWRDFLATSVTSAGRKQGMGFTASAQNGMDSGDARLMVKCGVDHPGMQNLVTLRFDECEKREKRITSLADVIRMLSATVRAWEPASAEVAKLGLPPRRHGSSGFMPAWLTYLPLGSERDAQAKELSVKVAEVDNLGVIYVLEA